MTEILCGVHAVMEALKAGRRRVEEVLAARAPAAEVVALAAQRGVPVRHVEAGELRRLSGVEKHQGIGARVTPFPYAPLARIVETAVKDPRGAFLVILDQIQDPQNLGSILRTAHCCGVHGVILPKDRAALVTPTVCRAAAGAVEHLPVARVTNIAETVKTLKSHNIWIVGADGAARQSVYNYQFRGGHAVILGAEEKGVRRLVREHCDILLALPLRGAIGSYNVAAAGAMILGEALRQRLVAHPLKTP